MALRIDRLTTLYVVDPILRRTSAGKSSISILMYHSITDEDEAGVHPYYRTTTTPSVFAAQMESLHHAGFSVVDLCEAVRTLSEPKSMKNGVVITFDDGYRNFYNNAFPILKRHGFTATVFLPTAYIGETHLSFKGKQCLSWSEVRELQRLGISFGSHTITHPSLRTLDTKRIESEVVVSKQTIEQNVGCAVESFAYPYAFPETDSEFKKGMKDTLVRAGYENGVCTTIGRAYPGCDEFFLKRLPVNSCDDSQLLRAKLSGAYDWLRAPQYLLKWLKQNVKRSAQSQTEV